MSSKVSDITARSTSNTQAWKAELNQQPIQEQQITEQLLDIMGRFKGTISAMEGELAVARNVKIILSQQLDVADQYSWRLYMIVMGLWKLGTDETNDKSRWTGWT